MNYRIYLLICVFSLFSFFSPGQGNNEQRESLVTINTEYGKIKLILFDDTPLHKENFLNLANAGVYDHIIFHRVINYFMIQTGDYTTRNQAVDFDPRVIQEPIQAEIRPNHLHVHGAIGAARKGDDENPKHKSNSTQFYIIQNSKGAHHLDHKYTVFGQVMSGFEVVDSIAKQPTTERDSPLRKMRITVDIDQVSRSDIEKFYNFTYK